MLFRSVKYNRLTVRIHDIIYNKNRHKVNEMQDMSGSCLRLASIKHFYNHE